ncbi:phosphatidylinositol N-acetylglucosaminyltransferase [Spizellomyces punctatus DAOM BR117]|uniref:N-acetylglucosaminyl transferase component Gpi1 n=1 Tax=Spizellomyces punctatus (strain DAOM BR117) TaxID=645134 RepID=A0A0L0HVJ7_SPIPD|nr:phosphatidylinositol N-acetylglucosaminyltransferase [Spizellomyces punctatus DAOM BR117]KND04909.1 hypothetical protein SPPG_00600 [Spizellomyces punctatus DAOM BR117]|eukprot:XP_016612948.1 hypothetical protein SPPG_00600 [Spizellomyces punctatus DAOM BR117]
MLVKLFWPDDLQKCAHITPKGIGYLVGWSTGSSSLCVSTVFPPTLKETLKSYIAKQASREIPPKLIGLCGWGIDVRREDVENLLSNFDHSLLGHVLVIVRMNSDGIPFPSYCYQDRECLKDTTVHIIYFARPNARALQYYSLHPLILDLTTVRDELTSVKTEVEINTAPPSVIPRTGRKLSQQIQSLFVEERSSGRVECLEILLHQVNLCFSLERALSRLLHANPSRASIIWAAGTRIFRAPFAQYIGRFILLVTTILRATAFLLIWMLNARFPAWLFQGTALKDLSAAAQQVDLRLQQACYWPLQYINWRRSPQKLSRLAQARYIGFYNTVWLVANDIIVGVAFGTFLMENSKAIAQLIDSGISMYTLGTTRSMISWLMGAPAGLKLNSELTSFLGEMFLELMVLWSDWIFILRQFLPEIIYVIGMCGVLGVAMPISLLSDLLSLVTLHLHLCYIVASKIYYWQVKGILSLFILFRGKKKNVLRNRIDTAEYGLDQLLLGTIVFTLLIFLFPTVAVYYILFSLVRLTIVLMQAVFEIMLAMVNHFPLFAIMLRFKDPKRLPAGITFEVCSPSYICKKAWWKRLVFQSQAVSRKVAASPKSVYMAMKSVPLGLDSIFYQYRYLWSRLRTHYLLSGIIDSLFTGRNIQSIPRLQYPTLPSRSRHRPTFSAVFQEIRMIFSEITDAETKCKHRI